MKRQNRIAFFNILSVLLINSIPFFTGSLFSRLLGTSGYGSLKIYNIWASVIAILFTLQTQSTLVNARVEYSLEEQDSYASSVMSLSVLVFLLCGTAVLIFIEPISELLRLEPMLIGLMLLQAFGTFSLNFLNTKFVYEFKAGKNMLTSLSLTLITLGLSLILILQLPQQIRYYGRVIAIAVTYGVIGIPACIYILAKGKTFIRRDYWKFCIALAVPSVFYNLSDLLLGQSDQVMLQQMLSETEVGQYSLAWTFGNVMFVIFGALNKTWCPFFFDEMKQGKRKSMWEKTANFLELFTVLSVGFILLAAEVYHFYASPDYWASTNLIPLFVSSYYLNFLCTFPVNFEYYHKRTKMVAAVTIAASLLNIVLNYFMIRWIGMAGAALATLISHGSQLVIHYLYCRYHLGDYPFGVRRWWKYAAAYFFMVVFVSVTGDFWMLRWGVGAALGLWELLRIRKRKVLI